jgi:hypothetical protein
MQVGDQMAKEVEKVLRLYGLTTGGEHFFSDRFFDIANVQGTQGGGVIGQEG